MSELIERYIRICAELPTLAGKNAMSIAKMELEKPQPFIPTMEAEDRFEQWLIDLDHMRDNLTDDEIGDLYENEAEWSQ